jgi:CRP/FNR family transcriptional regulator
VRLLCIPDNAALDHESCDSMGRCEIRHIPQGSHAYRAGDPCTFILGIARGSFKTVALLDRGQNHVIDFRLTNDLLGVEGLANNQHTSDAIALEDSVLRAFPRRRFEALCERAEQIQRHWHRVLCGEIDRGLTHVMRFGQSNAERRIAQFLLDLAKRSHRGTHGSDIELTMTRQDIGDHLGLRHETVSRALMNLHHKNWIALNRSSVTLVDHAALEML